MIVTALTGCGLATADDESQLAVRFVHTLDTVCILIDNRPFATYVYRDDQIPRPYFRDVHAPSGRLVTRPCPPGPDDLDDHPQMHPGLWLAFGDLSGNDVWRLRAPVEHVEFIEPAPRRTGSEFIVRNRYHSNGGKRVLCDEVCRYTVIADDDFTVLFWDSTFTPSDEPLVFGDQEEMGLGVRLASDIAEKTGQGGLLTDSEGRTTAAQVWGQSADWCDYSGIVNGQAVGFTVAAHSDNFRACWWHARDYGFMAANPFGRKAMKQGETSQIVVQPGEELRLRFAIIVHDDRPGDGYDPAKVISWKVTDDE